LNPVSNPPDVPRLGEELVRPAPPSKTQANSIYRTLGASTRSQATARARELGLPDG